jgi:hypothetical protein
MKQLLYLPSSKIVLFFSYSDINNPLLSIEEYSKKANTAIEDIIYDIIHKNFNRKIYKYAEIDISNIISREEFEIIDV